MQCSSRHWTGDQFQVRWLGCCVQGDKRNTQCNYTESETTFLQRSSGEVPYTGIDIAAADSGMLDSGMLDAAEFSEELVVCSALLREC